VSCTSGVLAGDGLAADVDAAGEFNLSEEGAGINDSRELVAALDVAVGFAVGGGGASASVGGGPDDCGVASTRVERDFGRGVGVASTCAGVAFGRGLKMPNHPHFFFGFSGATGAAAAVAVGGASPNLPWTIVPETRLETL